MHNSLFQMYSSLIKIYSPHIYFFRKQFVFELQRQGKNKLVF